MSLHKEQPQKYTSVQQHREQRFAVNYQKQCLVMFFKIHPIRLQAFLKVYVQIYRGSYDEPAKYSDPLILVNNNNFYYNNLLHNLLIFIICFISNYLYYNQLLIIQSPWEQKIFNISQIQAWNLSLRWLSNLSPRPQFHEHKLLFFPRVQDWQQLKVQASINELAEIFSSHLPLFRSYQMNGLNISLNITTCAQATPKKKILNFSLDLTGVLTYFIKLLFLYFFLVF
eukprot:TRINITY_DN8632_c0_g1_i10.p2 TRINITY_DN8632_c0_g1~~TRINITY_DN8632_c0_g1_i10.p2  ORF type:complete len:227 (+),score=-5.28 TRINITY_DN8632_c0_g1_i10:472-1152(+)